MSVDPFELAREEAELAMFEEGLLGRQSEQIAGFLGTYGDAVQERIDECLSDAKVHISQTQNKAALISCVTVVELIIRHFILLPIVQGAFLSEDWADILVDRILRRNSSGDRDLLPEVLKRWAIDLQSINLSDGRGLWKTFTSEVVPKRNRVVHNGEPASAVDSDTAISCAMTFLDEVVSPLSDKFGFSWSVTRRWNPTNQGEGGATSSSYYRSKSPF